MALPFPIPALPWKWIGVALAALAVISAVGFSIHAYGSAKYDAGVLEERSIWEKIVAEQNEEIAKLQRVADASLVAQRSKDGAKIAQSRKELEDALFDIPDQQTTDRQRAIACAELLRIGQDTPACQSHPTP